jgi:hypothetical protein
MPGPLFAILVRGALLQAAEPSPVLERIGWDVHAGELRTMLRMTRLTPRGADTLMP